MATSGSDPAKRRRRSAAGLIAAGLGLAVLAAFIFTIAGTHGAQAKASRHNRGAGIAATVAVGRVRDISLTSQLTLSGTVGAPEGPVSLSPATSGTVTALSISVGQAVVAGQTVAQLSDTQGVRAKQSAAQAQLAQAQAVLAEAQDPQSQPAAVAQAQDQVAAATAALQNARANEASDKTTAAARTSRSPAGTTGAQQQAEDAASVTDAQSQLAAAQQALATAEHPPPASANVVAADEAAVNAAQANLDAAGQAVAQLSVTAPVAGTVAQILVPLGGFASPTTPIATLTGQNETLTAQASPVVATALAGREGAKATASLAIPNPGPGVAATLTQVAPSANPSTQQTAVTFATSAALQPDAPVTITVDLPQPTGPVVASSAIVDDNNREGVFVVGDIIAPAALGIQLPANVPPGTEVGQATFTPITAGATQDNQTEVASGLHPGQTIVTTGQTDLASTTSSQRVAILPTGSRPSASRARSTAGSSGVDVTVVSVNGNTLTVATPIGQKTLTVPSGFPITDHGTPVALRQLRPGQVLKVTFARRNGKLTPTSAAVQ